MSTTGMERPIDLAQDAVARLIRGGRRGVLVLPMKPAVWVTPEVRAALAGGLLELGIDAAGMVDAELVDMAFREGLEPTWRCPWGRGGDVLWARELWASALGRVMYAGPGLPIGADSVVWRPAHTMPRDAARLVMPITDVGVTTAWPEPALCWRLEVEVCR